MGIIYILTLIVLGISFMIFKKSEEKLNFIKWLIIFLVSIYAYNITIGMVLGLLNITSHILLLSLINILVSVALGFKSIKNKDFQKYYIKKQDFIAVTLVLVIFLIMFIKDLYIYKGNITHAAVDSAVHYRAAKHYADNLKIFINVEDKTFFNFNVMQTGAYINDGIFMNVINSFTGINHCYLYQAFETMTLLLNGLAFFAIFMDKVKTKRGFILTFILFALYMYGYPYNSWIWGFSYLSVGITMIALLASIVETLYSQENIKKWFVIVLIGLGATGLIFSYCMFVPAIFAAICIYVFLKDLQNKEGKKYLKIFKKDTLIITGMLLIITFAGIGYLFIPTFFIEGQTDLISALKIDGAKYEEKFRNFLPYIPFAFLYCFELVRKIMKREMKYFDIFSICTMGYFALFYLGMLFGKVSPYYMLKTYYIIWMVIFGITIELINSYIDNKVLKWIMPIYIVLWSGFVCSWVWIKAGHVIGEEEKHALPNYVGMYYWENCEFRKQIDATQSFLKEQVDIVTYATDNFKDMTVDNTEMLTETYYGRIWTTAMLEVDSDSYQYEGVVQDGREHTLEEALEDERKKYVVCTALKDNLKQELEKYRESEKITILLENEKGYVVTINGR